MEDLGALRPPVDDAVGGGGSADEERARRDRGPLAWDPDAFDAGSWRRSAACHHIGPTVFFPAGVTGEAARQTAVATSVCRRCPVRLDCLRFSLETHQVYGIWGGFDELERREIKRRWRRTGAPLHLVAGLGPAASAAGGPPAAGAAGTAAAS